MAGRFTVESVFKAVDRVTAPVSRMQQRFGRFTRSMTRGLRSVNRTINKMGAGLWSLSKRVALVGTMLATGLALAINRVAKDADHLAKTVRRLEFPIEEFQEWRFVAEQSGVDTSLLESSLGAFTKRLGEARAGTGALVTLLKKTNPQFLKQLTAVEDTSQAFEMYLDFIRKGETATDKAARASAAFSRAGLKMVNITHNSADAVAALRAEQRANGVVTQAQAEAAEAYNDAVNSLKHSLLGLFRDVLLPMLPALTKKVRAWRELITANKDMINLKVRDFFEKILGVVADLRKAFAFMQEHSQTIFKVTATVLGLIVALKVLAAVMAVVNLVMAANPLGLIVIAIGALVAAVAAAVFWWDEIKNAFESLPGPVKAAVDAIMLPVTGLVEGAALIYENWGPIKAFFTDLWAGVVEVFDSAVARIMAIIAKVRAAVSTVVGAVSAVGGGVSDFFGFTPEEGGPQGREAPASIVSPQDRTAKLIEERRSTSSAEVTIRDESGRAELTKGELGSGLFLTSSGAF